MQKFRVVVQDDLFDITNRLKQIDKNYFVLFNKKTFMFEIHNKGFLSTYCFCCKTLDKTVLDRALMSQAKFADLIFKQVDEFNQKLACSKKDSLLYKHKTDLSNYFKFLSSSTKSVDFLDVNKSIWF